MSSAAFNFPMAEFCWYGIASVAFLLCFASLSYEVQHGLHACEKADNEDAWKVTWTTYQVNFIVMVVANIAFALSLVGTHMTEGDGARLFLAAGIFAGGSYLSYTRACERKLILFLKTIGIYPPDYRTH